MAGAGRCSPARAATSCSAACPSDGDWGRAWIEAVHPDDRARYAEHTARYLRGEMSEVRCRMIGLDGVTRWIVGGGMPRRIGDRLIVEGIVREPTVEVRAERAAARGRTHRRADRALQSPPLLRGARGRARELAPRGPHARRPALIDVDHFKTVNDTYGHQVGDAVLTRSPRGCAARCARYDCVARWGGEEFIVLAPSLERRAPLWRICQALRESVSQVPIAVGERAARRHGLGRRACSPTRPARTS